MPESPFDENTVSERQKTVVVMDSGNKILPQSNEEPERSNFNKKFASVEQENEGASDLNGQYSLRAMTIEVKSTVRIKSNHGSLQGSPDHKLGSVTNKLSALKASSVFKL